MKLKKKHVSQRIECAKSKGRIREPNTKSILWSKVLLIAIALTVSASLLSCRKSDNSDPQNEEIDSVQNWPPPEWLEKRLDRITDAEAIMIARHREVLQWEIENDRVFPGTEKQLKEMEQGDFGEEWTAFKKDLNEEGELWWFNSPKEDWDNLGGACGFVVVKDGLTLSKYILELN